MSKYNNDQEYYMSLSRYKFLFTKGLMLVTVLVFTSGVLAAEKKWYAFNEGLALAEKQNKSIMVDFYADWCHWCKVMDKNTFQDKVIAKKLADRFISIKLDAEDAGAKVQYEQKSYTNVQLTQAFGITGFPSLAFLDAKGKIITVLPGYVPPEEFINVLNYIDGKCWEQNVSFEDYLKNKDCGKKS